MTCLPSVKSTEVATAPNQDVVPGDIGVRENLEDQGKEQRGDEERGQRVGADDHEVSLADDAASRIGDGRQRGAEHQRDEQKKTDGQHHGDGQQPLLEEAPDRAPARLVVDAPDAVERALELGEDRGRSDQEDDQTDRERPGFLLGVVRAPQYGLRDLGPGGADQIAHLGDELLFHRGALEHETGHGHHHQDERGQGRAACSRRGLPRAPSAGGPSTLARPP